MAINLLNDIAEIEGIKSKKDKEILHQNTRNLGVFHLVNKGVTINKEEENHGKTRLRERKIKRIKREIDQSTPIDPNEEKRIKTLPNIILTDLNDQEYKLKSVQNIAMKLQGLKSPKVGIDHLTDFKKFDIMFQAQRSNDQKNPVSLKKRSSCFIINSSGPGNLNTVEGSSPTGRRKGSMTNLSVIHRGKSLTQRRASVASTESNILPPKMQKRSYS